MYYFAIEENTPGFLPKHRKYHSTDSLDELVEIVQQAREDFAQDCEEDCGCNATAHALTESVIGDLRVARYATSATLNCTIASSEDKVLNIIGLNKAEYERKVGIED